MGSVRSLLVLTVNSQWGWCFLSMQKELRHFLLFKQGPFFFQRTGKATRDSHSASNRPSTTILGTKELEWRKKKRNAVHGFFWYPFFAPIHISAVSTLSNFMLGLSLNFQALLLTAFMYSKVTSKAIRNIAFTYPSSSLQSKHSKGYQQDDKALRQETTTNRPSMLESSCHLYQMFPFESIDSSMHQLNFNNTIKIQNLDNQTDTVAVGCRLPAGVKYISLRTLCVQLPWVQSH